MADQSSSKSTRWLIIAVIILLLAILAYSIFRPHKPVITTPVVKPTTTTQPMTPAVSPAVQQEQQIRQQAGTLEAVARTFTEHYGSFSSQAQNQNIQDVLSLMTASFAATSSAQIAASKPSTTFYGIVTQAVMVTVNAEDDTAGTATVTVSAQRVETTGTAASTVRYQDLVLTFKKIGTDWKVDSATWK